MNIQEFSEEGKNENDVKKVAYCDMHTPSEGNKSLTSVENEDLSKREQTKRIKRVRKILSERQPTL